MKKKILFISLIVCSMFFMVDDVFAGTFYCKAIGVDAPIDEQIPTIIRAAILIMQICVPVILVIMGSIDLLKAIYAQKEDEIKKGQQIFIKRLISALIVFFVIAIVKFVISAVGSTDDPSIMSCAKCLIYGPESTNGNC